MFCTILTESCFLVVIRARVIGVAKHAAALHRTTARRVIHTARTHTMTRVIFREAHAKNALGTRIVPQIYAKIMRAKPVTPGARHATELALMTANHVTHTAHTRTTSAAIHLAATATSALRTRIVPQIYAKITRAKPVIPGARHATELAPMTANPVTHQEPYRTTSAALFLAAGATSALRTRIVGQARFVRATPA